MSGAERDDGPHAHAPEPATMKHGALTRPLDVPVSAVVLTGLQGGTTVPLRGRLRIGKADDNDIALADDAVSRHHCEISRTPAGVQVHDLGSTNGTFLEGARIVDAIAPIGSVLRIGGVSIALRPDAELVEVAPYDHGEYEGVIGQSTVMRRIFRVADTVARTDTTVLLLGETGTGKEVLARAIATRSARAQPFVVVDSSAVTPSLISSELFGHERGAFTGAVAQRKGAFESAHGGTIFLDEIGELPLDVQPMLLRVLESREFRRVGGPQTLRADVRIIAATSRDLEREVSAGKFREDLYFRLAVVPIRIPPLRARREDIPVLVRHILSRTNAAADLTLGNRTMQWLLQHDWPGNVRELRNVLERAACMSVAAGGSELRLHALPGANTDAIEHLFRISPDQSYGQARARVEEEFERRYVSALLAEHRGNVSAAARAAQMDRKYLGKLARKHGVMSGDGSD